MWGLGCLIWEVFNGPLPKTSALKAFGKVRLLFLSRAVYYVPLSSKMPIINKRILFSVWITVITL